MKTIQFLALAFAASGQVVADTASSCGANMKWLIATFAENDAGYAYVVDAKGPAALEQHNARHELMAESADDSQACEDAMRSWLEFFRRGHIGVRAVEEPPTSDSPGEEALREYYGTFPIHDIDVEAFLEGMREIPANSIEGVWRYGIYTVGITKAEGGEEYVGFVIEADGVYWHPGQVKLRFSEDRASEVLSGEFFMRDHSARSIEPVRLMSDNILQAGFSTWRRVLPDSALSADEAFYLESADAERPYFRALSDKTGYVRIPSFAYEDKIHIDAVIQDHGPEISARANLIIDLRGNGGGSDASYWSLLPLLYTNPIRVVGVEMLSTPLNNAKYAEILHDDAWSDDDKAWIKDIYDRLNDDLGRFVSIAEHPVTVHEAEQAMPTPERVAIIIDERNASTTEQFILASKQSLKTKLFGVATMGVLDFANVHQAHSPDGRFVLWYATSITRRLPHFPVDGIGLQPDYYLDDAIPSHMWVSHVQAIMETDLPRARASSEPAADR
jgi:hypothetical protein